MEFNVAFKVGPFSSLKQWSGEAESPKEAMTKGLEWVEESSALGIKASAVTQVLVVWEEAGKTKHEVFDLPGNGSTTPMDSGASKSKKSKKSKKGWPFKHLQQKSSWPMQPLVLQMAAAVLQVPEQARKEAAQKTIERCMRMGARIAREFGLHPVKVLQIAQAQIEREIPGSKAEIAEAKISEAEKVSEMAEALVSGQLSSLFGKSGKGEA